MDNVKQWTGLSLPVLLDIDTAQDRNVEGEKKKRTPEEDWGRRGL